MKTPTRRKELMDRLIKEEVVKTVLSMIHEDQPLTMDDVASRCGVSKGTLYNYFKNKKALLSFVHEAMIFPIKNGADQLFGKSICPMEKLYTFVKNVFNFHKEYPLYFKFIQSQRSAAEATDEKMSLTILPLVKVCKEGMASGDFVNMDPYVMAAMIFGAVTGPMESLGYREEPIQDIEAFKKDIICLLDRSILKKQEKSR